MQFACEKCDTKYAVPDEKIAGKRVRTQCRKCGAEILIEGPMGKASAYRPRTERLTGSAFTTQSGQPGPSGQSGSGGVASQRSPTSRATPVARDDNQWTVAFSKDDRRQMTTAEIAEAYVSGQVTSTTPVWKIGMESWRPPFEVPVIAIALAARGFTANQSDQSDREESAPISLGRFDGPTSPRLSPQGPTPAALRIQDMRRTAPARPSNIRRSPSIAPTDPHSKATAPRRALPRPGARGSVQPAATDPAESAVSDLSVQRSLTPGPVPDVAWQEDTDDEATLALPDKADLPASNEGSPITARGVGQAPETRRALEPPTVPGAAAFEFENETTEVIAPDRARQLLETESARTTAGTAEPARPSKPPTRLDFIFDDEATAVIAPEKATALLSDPLAANSIPEAPGDDDRPVPKAPPLAPYPSVSQRPAPPPPAAGAPPPPPPKLTPYPQAIPLPGLVPQPPPEPSIVVTDARRRAIPDELTRTLPPKVTRELGNIQHEKTRLVRVVKKPGSTGTSFWVVLALALAAAATGGFLASQMIQRHGPPAWLKSK